MLEKATRGFKLFAGAVLLLLILQTLALGAIYQELINIRVQANVQTDLLMTIGRNQP
jgi:hypothetical protein